MFQVHEKNDVCKEGKSLSQVTKVIYWGKVEFLNTIIKWLSFPKVCDDEGGHISLGGKTEKSGWC